MSSASESAGLESGFYYLIIEAQYSQSYVDRIESLCSQWFVQLHLRLSDVAIIRNIPLGDLPDTLARSLSLRSSFSKRIEPARVEGAPEAGSAYETILVYYIVSHGLLDSIFDEVGRLDSEWQDAPAPGFISSIAKTNIDIEDVDACLVACVSAGFLYHPDKDTLKNDAKYQVIKQTFTPELKPVVDLDIATIRQQLGVKLIETKLIRREQLPTDVSRWFDPENERDPRSPLRLALSFAGYEFLGEQLFDLLRTVEQIAHSGQPRVLDCFNTTGLRLLLFGLQRRSHNDMSLETDALTRAIIEKLRERLE